MPKLHLTTSAAALIAAFLSAANAAPIAPDDAPLLTALLDAEAVRGQRITDFALRTGLPTAGTSWFLYDVAPDGMPLYMANDNLVAGRSTKAEQIRDTAPYNVDGDGVTVGVWEIGGVFAHAEFADRLSVQEAAPVSSHATHVVGTVAAAGDDPDAVGAAPGVSVQSWDAAGDLAEMFAAAGGETPLPLSTHSYGPVIGWHRYSAQRSPSGLAGWHYSGSLADTEPAAFGRYGDRAQAIDANAISRPNHLSFWSASNNRGDGPAGAGAGFVGMNGNGWAPMIYNTNNHPPLDGAADAGYDTMGGNAVAKNVLTIGAVSVPPNRDLGAVVMSDFSGWGPTDDGRVKPDLVAHGVGVYSTETGEGDGYTRKSGTSMATPAAAGASALLYELAEREWGEAPIATTLKALLIHSADDLGLEGPDFQYGWGLINAERAADLVLQHAESPYMNRRVEATLVEGETHEVRFVVPQIFSGEVKATLVWNDPPGAVQTGTDSAASVLTDDLDLAIRRLGDRPETFQPWKPRASRPDRAAGRGRNSVDNVEQVLIANATPGTYIAEVSHTGDLFGGGRQFSLILTGQLKHPEIRIVPADVDPMRFIIRNGILIGDGRLDGIAGDGGIQLDVTNTSPELVEWTYIPTDPDPLIQPVYLGGGDGKLDPGETESVRFEPTSKALAASPGNYAFDIVFNNPAAIDSEPILRPAIVSVLPPDPPLTQVFPGEHDPAPDLDYTRITFTPDGSGGYTKGFEFISRRDRIDSEPILVNLPLVDGNDSIPVSFSGGETFPFYGQSYTKVFVYANGYLTFGAAATETKASLSTHFSRPEIAALFTDLALPSGGVTAKQLSDRIEFTWEGAALEVDSDRKNSFQIELHFDGVIVITFLDLDADEALVGLSDGNGIPGDFIEGDLNGADGVELVTVLAEAFDAAEGEAPDLAFTQIAFLPGGEGDYILCHETNVDTLPVPAAGGIVFAAGNDTSKPLALNGRSFPFFGEDVFKIHLGPNGYLVMGDEDDRSAPTTDTLLSAPRIAALMADLRPDLGGNVYTHLLDDRLAVTFDNVPEDNTGEKSTFQIELYNDGKIRITYLEIGAPAFAAGLSASSVIPPIYTTTDLSDALPCPKPNITITTVEPYASEFDPADTAVVRVTRDGFTDHVLKVFVEGLHAFGATPEDTTETASTLFIEPGDASADFEIAAIPDDEIEGEQVVVMYVTPSVAYHESDIPTLIGINDKPFDNWRHFYSAGFFHKDDDGDGRSNGEEYAFGGDPSRPDTAAHGPTPFASEIDGDPHYGVTFQISEGSIDLDVRLQSATDLDSWIEEPFSWFPALDASGDNPIFVLLPAAPGGRAQFRVELERIPQLPGL